MSVKSDFRYLATKDLDTMHKQLRWCHDLAFDIFGLTVKVEYNEKNEPMVGTCFKFNDPCPVAPNINTHLKYWVADSDRPQEELNPYFEKSIINFDAEMNKKGSGGLWGYIPKRCTHLLAYLEPVVASGLCKLVDGATINYKTYPHLFNDGKPLDDTDHREHYFAFGTLSDGEEFYLGVEE